MKKICVLSVFLGAAALLSADDVSEFLSQTKTNQAILDNWTVQAERVLDKNEFYQKFEVIYNDIQALNSKIIDLERQIDKAKNTPDKARPLVEELKKVNDDYKGKIGELEALIADRAKTLQSGGSSSGSSASSSQAASDSTAK